MKERVMEAGFEEQGGVVEGGMQAHDCRVASGGTSASCRSASWRPPARSMSRQERSLTEPVVQDSEASTEHVGEVRTTHSGFDCAKHGGNGDAGGVLGDTEGFADVVSMGSVGGGGVGAKYIHKALLAIIAKQDSLMKPMKDMTASLQKFPG